MFVLYNSYWIRFAQGILSQVIDVSRAGLEVRAQREAPAKGGMAQFELPGALTDLAFGVGPEDGTEHLDEAISNLESVLSIYDSVTYLSVIELFCR